MKNPVTDEQRGDSLNVLKQYGLCFCQYYF